MTGNFSESVQVPLQLGVVYDMCTKNWQFRGDTVAPVVIQKFSVDNTSIGFTRKYDSVSNTSSFGELMVRGVISIIGMLFFTTAAIFVIHFIYIINMLI